MAGEERIATLDVAPQLLGEFAAVIGSLAKIVGSAESDGAVRLKVLVPVEFGPQVMAEVEKRRGSITYRLAPAS